MSMLNRIAGQLRKLPSQKKGEDIAAQADGAGALVVRAMNAGAFEWSKNLREIREQTYDNIDVANAGNAAGAFWIMIHQSWLKGYKWAWDFEADCNHVADLIEKEPDRSFLAITEAALACDVSKSAISKWCDSGRIASIGHGKDRFVDVRDVARLRIEMTKKRL